MASAMIVAASPVSTADVEHLAADLKQPRFPAGQRDPLDRPTPSEAPISRRPAASWTRRAPRCTRPATTPMITINSGHTRSDRPRGARLVPAHCSRPLRSHVQGTAYQLPG